MALPGAAARCSSNPLDWMSTPLKYFTADYRHRQRALDSSRNFNLNYKPG
jgi:hypothetical protein